MARKHLAILHADARMSTRLSVSARVWLALCLCGCGATESVTTTDSPTNQASTPSSLAVAATSASVSTPLAAPNMDPLAGGNILRDAVFLSGADFRGRFAGTDDERRAADFIAQTLDARGVAAPVAGRRQPFEFGSPLQQSENVFGLLAAKNPDAEWIVVGAHYDHEGVRDGKVFPGAEDNASGVAVALAVAQGLRNDELQRHVLFAFFGAEERGLRGSRAFVADWDFDKRPVSLMVNIDMIGRPLVDQPLLWFGASILGVLDDVDPKQAVGVLLPPDSDALEKLVRGSCKKGGISAVTIADLPDNLRAPVADLARGRGDHAPFEKQGIPFVFFSSGESSDYHRTTDTADKLDPAILEARARVISDVIRQVAALPRGALAAKGRGW